MTSKPKRGVVLALEILLALALLGAAAQGLWRLNRPLPEAAALLVSGVPDGATLLDARGPLAYRRAHLPGALQLWSRDLLAFSGETPGTLAAPEVIAGKLRALGLEPGSSVVVYDDGAGQDAPLVTLVLRAFGLDAYLLEGGLDAQQLEGATPSADLPPAPTPSRSVFDLDERLLVEAAGTRRHLDEGAIAPVDVRDAALYAEGHLSGAVNLDVDTLLPEGRLPRWSTLDDLLGRARLTRDTHPIVYGSDAAEAGRAWLALAAYGVEHIHVYAGPFQGLVVAGLPISQETAQAATSRRTSSVCWR